LHEEPKNEEDKGRDFYELKKEKDRNECQDLGARVKEEVGSHDTGYGSARPDGRDIGIPIDEKMNQTSRQTTKKIEDEISNVTEPVLDVIPEDIEKPHVHDNMKESSVKKHGSQKREILLETRKVSGEFRIGVSEGDHSVEIKDFL
jgi:hypothetical protein